MRNNHFIVLQTLHYEVGDFLRTYTASEDVVIQLTKMLIN